MQGVVHLNDTLLLGPTGLGEFLPVVIRGIQRKRLPVSEVRGGQTASFALKKVKENADSAVAIYRIIPGVTLLTLALNPQIKRNQIRKGMVMVDPSLNPSACWEFEGDILVLHHPTTISTKYQAMGENFEPTLWILGY